MEQHPIPQNVTNFQFRLIGDMTIKQFAYLAVGAILAFITYKLPLPPIFTWPLAFLFAFGGFGFAFIPIEERPMDVWVLSFFKNVYNPTIFTWSQKKPTPNLPPISPPVGGLPPPPPIAPKPDPLLQARSMQDRLDALEKELKIKEDLLAQLQVEQPAPAPKPTPPPPPPPPTPPAPQTPTVNVMLPGQAVRAGIPKLTSYPNIVSGIIKDDASNLLPGILVTIRDHEDVPVRALKTNKLGQFAASTQLVNGVYLIESEDPRGRFIFDKAQITLNGNVMPPLEITAKSQKQLNRAKLAQEIFGNQNKSEI